MKSTTSSKRTEFHSKSWEEIEASGENINDDDYAARFDERPTYNDPPEPGVFKKIYTAIRHSTVAKKISGFFHWIGEGVDNAASYVRSIFSKPEKQAAALRNVREAGDVSDMIQAASRELIKHSTSEAIPTSLLVKSVQSNSSGTKGVEEIANVSEIIDKQNPKLSDSVSSSIDAGERAFKLWMNDFSRYGDQAICQTNFETAAKAHAKAIYDKEVERCAACAGKPEAYFLSTEDSKKLEAAAALLKKSVPRPASMKDGPGVKVAPFSLDGAANFLAWQSWKGGGKLPAEGSISLDIAAKFADEFIATHNTAEDKLNKAVAQTLEDAFDLITYQEDYAVKLASAAVEMAADNVLAALSALAEDTLPDSLPSVETSTSPEWRFPGIGLSDQTLMREAIAPAMSPREFSRMLIMAGLFLDARGSGDEPPEGSKAFALTLASLWEKALKDPERLEKLSAMEDFGRLKLLLVVETVEADTPFQIATRQSLQTEASRVEQDGPPPTPPPRVKKDTDAGPPPPPPPRRSPAQQPPGSIVTASTVPAEQSQEAATPPKLPAFPIEATSLSLGMIKLNYQLNELRTIIQGARRYFAALAKGSPPAINDKASAITLANLWTLAKSDASVEREMQALEFFNALDQLLQTEKIQADFR